MAVGTADAGEFTTRVAAVEISPHDLLDDGPEKPVLILEAALIKKIERGLEELGAPTTPGRLPRYANEVSVGSQVREALSHPGPL